MQRHDEEAAGSAVQVGGIAESSAAFPRRACGARGWNYSPAGVYAGHVVDDELVYDSSALVIADNKSFSSVV